MRKLRYVISIALAIVSIAALTASPASGDTLRFSEGAGQPAVSGHLEGEGAHGAIHCQPVAEAFLGETQKAGAPGVVVINPTGTYLGAPRGGTCELIYGSFAQ